jgi:hypothetical protein
MTQNLPEPMATTAPTDPAEAFEALRREVTLLHSAIQGLTAARENIPNYSPTLARMQKQLEETNGYWLKLEDRLNREFGSSHTVKAACGAPAKFVQIRN